MTTDTTKPRQFIARLVSHFDDRQRRIDEFQVVEGELPPDAPRFVAHHQIKDLGGSVQFAILATDIRDAFDKYDTTAAVVEPKFRKRVEDQKNTRRILTARDMPTSLG